MSVKLALIGSLSVVSVMRFSSSDLLKYKKRQQVSQINTEIIVVYLNINISNIKFIVSTY